jgi:pyruvate dehydrogenase E2 component (dihydrolipoamide acetyltransferase)
MTLTAITMPKWGLTMTEGKVVYWSQEEGTAFKPGDDLLEIETSKITNVVEAEVEATLLRIIAPEGATLPIGALLAVTGPSDAPAEDVDAYVAGFAVAEVSDQTDALSDAPTPKEATVAGQRLRYLDLGSGGPPLLLVHGFGGDLNTWMFVQPGLAAERRVLALDLPGHGGSGRDVGAGDLAVLADVVEAFITEVVGGAVHLVGHSMGGAIALALAQRRPDLVTSLTLVAPAGLGPEINGAFIDGFVRMGRRKEAQDVLRLLVHDSDGISRSMVEDVLRFKRLDGVPVALETIARAWFPDGRQAWIYSGAVTVPTQVIWGHEDQIIPASHAGIAPVGTAVHLLDGVGHLPHMERASDVARLIARFIELA